MCEKIAECQQKIVKSRCFAKRGEEREYHSDEGYYSTNHSHYAPLASPDGRATFVRTVGRSLSGNQELAVFEDELRGNLVLDRGQGEPWDITCGGGCGPTGFTRVQLEVQVTTVR